MMFSQNPTSHAPRPAEVVSDNGGSPSSLSSTTSRSQHSDNHRFVRGNPPNKQSVFKQGPSSKPINALEALAMLASAEVEQHQPSCPKPNSSHPELVSSSSEESLTPPPKSKSRSARPKSVASADNDIASNAISKNDVLCGRGGLTNHHPGNVFFRRLVRLKQEEYLMASKREKAGVSKEIVELIRRLEPSGRFLKRDPKNPGVWVEIGDRKAREKTSQALREGAPELREEIQTSMAAAENQPPKRRSVTRPPEPRQEPRSSPTPTAPPTAFLDPYLQQHPHPHLYHHGPTPETVHSNRARVVSDDNVSPSGNIQGVRPPSRFEHPPHPHHHHQRLGYHSYPPHQHHHHHHHHHGPPPMQHYEHAPPPPSSYESHLQHYAERQLHIATPPPVPRHVIPASTVVSSMPVPPAMADSTSVSPAEIELSSSSSGQKRKLPQKQEQEQSKKFFRKGSAGPRLKLLKSRLAKSQF